MFGVLACAGGNGAADDSGQHGMKSVVFDELTLVRFPGGYGGAPAAPESTCNPYADRDTLRVDEASSHLSWDLCVVVPPNVYTRSMDERALSEPELHFVEQTLADLEVGTPEGMCGADGGFLTLDVRTGSSTALYISNSSCPVDFSAGRTTATGVGQLWLALQGLIEE